MERNETTLPYGRRWVWIAGTIASITALIATITDIFEVFTHRFYSDREAPEIFYHIWTATSEVYNIIHNYQIPSIAFFVLWLAFWRYLQNYTIKGARAAVVVMLLAVAIIYTTMLGYGISISHHYPYLLGMCHLAMYSALLYLAIAFVVHKDFDSKLLKVMAFAFIILFILYAMKLLGTYARGGGSYFVLDFSYDYYIRNICYLVVYYIFFCIFVRAAKGLRA